MWTMLPTSLPRTRMMTYLVVFVVTNFLCVYSGWMLREGSGDAVGSSLSASRRRSPQTDSSDSIDRSTPVHSKMQYSTFHSPLRLYRNKNILMKKAKILKLLQSFRPAMTVKETELLSDILHLVRGLLDNNAVLYFLYGGSLLGSLRHHGLVPWDDDVDIIVPRQQRQRIYKVLNSLQPQYFLDVKQKARWKFYSVLSRPIRGHSWSWPFLDISFYDENSTHIWDVDSKFSHTFVYDKTRIFPLKMRPFMDMMVLAPRDSQSVLLQNYNPDVCESNVYNHRDERSTPSLLRKSVPCSVLKDIFPFVNRTPTRQGINETLEVKGHVLKWFLDPYYNS